MKYTNRELLDQLAAQYVVGTLRGRARQRFERICITNEFAAAASKRWEDRFVSMSMQIKPVTPPTQVWHDVERRLGFSKVKASVGASRLDFLFDWLKQNTGTAVFASVVVVALTVGVLMRQSQQQSQYQSQQIAQLQTIAVIAQAERGDLWRVRSEKDGASVVIEATAQVTLDAEHAYELWALPDSGAAPVSLGLLPHRGAATLALTALQQAALKGASKIAVSLEPLGGSTTGAPTGPVLHVANVTKLS